MCNCKKRDNQPTVRPVNQEPQVINVPVPTLTEDQMDKMTDEEKEQWEKLNNQ